MLTMCAMVVVAGMGPIELRGGRVIDPPIESVGVEGVVVGGDEARVIGWDAVKRVTGEFAEEAGAYAGYAEDAWRAKMRLARGDVRLAESLLESLWVVYRDKSGPTALLVAEGVLVCRTARGEQVEAVDAWLRAVRLRSMGDRLAGDPAPAATLDPETLLCPWLAPVWLDGPELREFAESFTPGVEDVSSAYRVLYRGIARRTMGMDAEIPEGSDWPEGKGVVLLRAMLAAQAEDSGERSSAREVLRGGLAGEVDTWQEAWMRAGLGISYLKEDSVMERTRGVFHLLHVAARFSGTQPQLAGVALARVGAEMAHRGDGAAAQRMLTEIRAIDASHPAAEWLRERLREVDVVRGEESEA